MKRGRTYCLTEEIPMNKLRWLALAALLVLAGTTGSGQENRGVQVKVVKYTGLKDMVVQNRGKVVLIDFWGDFCPSCKQAMPRVVKLHRDYARDGLVVISVSIDDLRHGNYEETKGRVHDFLQKQGADFTNVILDEHLEVCQEKLRVKTVPCYYVFNRQGKWIQFGGNDSAEKIDFAVMDRKILDLLRDR